jgi:hypothetical protein
MPVFLGFVRFVSYSSFHVIVGVPSPKSLHSPCFKMTRISSSSS